MAPALVFWAALQAVPLLLGGFLELFGDSEPTVPTHAATSLKMVSALRLGKRKLLLRVPSSSTDQVNSCLSTTLSHGPLLAAMWLVQSSEPSTCASPVNHELSTLRSAFVIQKHHV